MKCCGDCVPERLMDSDNPERYDERMTDYRVNEARVRAMMAGIRANPDNWNQDYWALKTECGTTMCAAGTVCAQAGLPFEFASNANNTGERPGWLASHQSVFIAATELLNMSYEDADTLFYSTTFCPQCSLMNRELDEDHGYDCPGEMRHPTVDEFEAFVTRLTGVQFKQECSDVKQEAEFS